MFPWLQDLHKIPQSFDDIASGFLEGPTSENVNMWWAAINYIKESLWTSRNVLVFNRVSVPKQKVLKSILNIRIIFSRMTYIRTDKKTSRKVESTKIFPQKCLRTRYYTSVLLCNVRISIGKQK